MQPNFVPRMYHLIYPCLPNVIYQPNEVFIHGIHRSGININYAVSNYGRVFSFYRNIIMRQFIDKQGYHRIELRLGLNETCFFGVHYLELMSFFPIYNTDVYIPNHIDGNPGNNSLTNLEWVTVSENSRHALSKGLITTGENSSRSILSNDTVRDICSKLEMGYSGPEVATQLFPKLIGSERNKIVGAINHIRRGQTYLDISKNYDIPGLNGRTEYEPEMTKEICEILSKSSISLNELCDQLNIPLTDRKMFSNYVRDITRGQKHTYIVNQYEVLNRVTPVDKSNPDYTWYY